MKSYVTQAVAALIVCSLSALTAVVDAAPGVPPAPRGRGEPAKNYLITFGDSYSKTGFDPKHQDQPRAQNPLGNPALPGKTSAGGRNWVGYMVTEFNTSLALDKEDSDSLTVSYNFASSGGTVDRDLVQWTGPDFIDEVDSFTGHYGKGHRKRSAGWTATNSVVGIWFGANDIRRCFLDNKAGSKITKVMGVYFEQVERLYALGLRKFVLLTAPPLSMMPDVQILPDQGLSGLNSAIKIWNGLLRYKLEGLKQKHSDMVASVVDISEPFWAAVRDPAAFGAPDTLCTNSDGVSCLWWDGMHPATKIERLIAAKVADRLKEDDFRCYGGVCDDNRTELR